MYSRDCTASKKKLFCETSYYLVDKKHPLPPHYVPEDLVVAPIPFVAPRTDPRCLIRSNVYFPLLSLYFSARDEGLYLYGVSAFRSYADQRGLYEQSIRSHGYAYTRKYIAPPGTSEHQTGLAIDLSCKANHFETNENFAHTKEGIWLKENAPKFGFVLSYPEISCLKNGYAYEPWHIRYTCKHERFYGMIN